MSKKEGFDSSYSWQSDDEDIVCPYCGETHAPNGDYYEGEMECNSCQRMFDISNEVEVTFTTQKDCALNDEPHDLKYGGLTRNDGAQDLCQKCGKWVDSQ